MKTIELHKERLRSDPTGTWQKEQDWADSVAGGPIDQDGSRLFRAWGFDLPEQEFGNDLEPVLGCEQEGKKEQEGEIVVVEKGHSLTEENMQILFGKIERDETVDDQSGVSG